MVIFGNPNYLNYLIYVCKVQSGLSNHAIKCKVCECLQALCKNCKSIMSAIYANDPSICSLTCSNKSFLCLNNAMHVMPHFTYNMQNKGLEFLKCNMFVKCY